MKNKTNKGIIEEEKLDDRLFRKLKRYDIQFSCFDEVSNVLKKEIDKALKAQKSKTLQALKKEVEGMKKKIKTLDPYDQVHLVRANIENKKKRSSNYVLSQVIKLIKKYEK